MTRLRCAILDDYMNLTMQMADWSKISDRVDLTVFNQPFTSTEAAASAATSLSESYKWFLNEANKVRDRFAPYLDFESWRSQRHDAV